MHSMSPFTLLEVSGAPALLAPAQPRGMHSLIPKTSFDSASLKRHLFSKAELSLQS